MKEIRFSKHSQDKIDILARHGMTISKQFVLEIITNPDKIETQQDSKIIAEKPFNDNLVIRVVYRQFNAFILIITLYPARRNRYEKNHL